MSHISGSAAHICLCEIYTSLAPIRGCAECVYPHEIITRQFLTYEAYEAITTGMWISETPRQFFGVQTHGLPWLSHGVGGTQERRNICDAFDELYMMSKIHILLVSSRQLNV
jgi:hypothetical protein